MSHKTGFYEGRLGIGLANDGGDGAGNPRFPLDVNGDIRLTGAILKANGEKYLGGLTKIGFDNMTELQNGNIGVGTDAPTVLLDISGDTKISGDLNIIGTLQMNGSTPTYSNWTNSGDDIYRDSKVTIGQSGVNTSYTLYVNGSINGSSLYIGGGKLVREANTTDYGGIKVGYGENGKNYPVELSSGKAYVNVPWTDTVYSLPATRSFTSLTNGNLTITSSAFIVSSGDAYFNQAGGGATYIGNTNNDTKINTSKVCIKGITGNVGIGTTSPERTLHLYGSRTDIVFDGSGFEKHYIRKDGHYLRFRGNDDSTVLFELRNNTTGNNVCSFPSGNVGIGTTSPGSILELSKSVGTEDDYSLMLNFKNSYSSYWDWSIGPYINDSNAKFSIRGGDNGFNNLNNLFTIVGTGNVGIGTTSPTRLLHLHNSETNGITYLMMSNNATGTGTNDGFQIINEQDGQIALKQRENKDFKIFTNNTQRLTIKNAGNVGIGTTSPGHKMELYVSSGYVRLGIKSSTTGSMVIGTHNDGRAFFYNEKNSYMHFGTNNTERMRIEADGKLLVPSGHTKYCASDSGWTAWYAGSGGGKVQMRLHGSWVGGSNNTDHLWYVYAHAHSRYLIQANYDGVGIYGQYNLSDDRLKHNEVTVSNGLDIINKLTPKKYFKTDKMYEADHHFELNEDGKPVDNSNNIIDYKIETGFIAQELLEIDELKHLVRIPQNNDISNNTPKNDGYGIYYNDLFVYNIAATQELYKENQELKTEVATLKSELAAIKAHLGI